MKRIKAGAQAITRVKTNPDKTVTVENHTESAPIERIKPKATRLYSGGFTKDPKTKMFLKGGEYYKLIDGCYFKAWPDGNIKDQKTATHVCWFGKITRKATQEELMAASMAIRKCMVKCFPEMYYNMETGERENQITEDGLYIQKTYV
jgi:hypothetical protein